jgi:hypothetical protein
LLEKLRSEEGEPKLNVIRALGELGEDAPKEVIDALVNVLREADLQVQRQAVLSLGIIGPRAARAEEAIASLVPAKLDGLLGDPEKYGLALQIVSTLGRVGATKPVTLSKLASFFELGDPQGDRRLLNELRQQLFVTLGAIDGKALQATPEIRAKVIGKLKELVRAERTPAVLEEAVIALVKVSGAEELGELVRTNDLALRQAALVALTVPEADRGREANLGTMFQGADAASLLPISAIRSLVSRGPGSIPVLVAALRQFNKNYAVRERLVTAIGEVVKNSEDIVQVIAKVSEIQDPGLQLAMIRSLQSASTDSSAEAKKEIRQALERRLNDPKVDEAVRRAALAAMFASLEPDETIPGTLETASIDKDLDKYYKLYTRTFEKGYLYQIDVKSREFDAFLYLKNSGTTIAFDDDSGGNLNARLIYDPSETVTLNIWATTYARRTLGSFTVEIRKILKTPSMGN